MDGVAAIYDVYYLHAARSICTYDAASIEKEDYKGHVHRRDKPTQHGSWKVIGVGALAGILFPPSIIGSAIVGGTAGGVIGHLRKGMSRDDLKELGDALDEGNAALIVMGESRIDEQIDKAVTRAQKVLQKQVD